MYNCYTCPLQSEVTTDLVRIIGMQRRAVREELNDEFCSSSRLGCGRRDEFNTRPIQLFTDDDKPWSVPIDRFASVCEGCPKTCVFRVERVNNGCVTLRGLIDTGVHPEFEEVTGHGSCTKHKYLATDSFITLKLNCICAIRCLGDTFVDLCIRNIP